MSRFVVNNLPIEMFALWLLELALSYYLAVVLLTSGAAAAGLGVPKANQAFFIALAVVSTAFLIGLYRPAVFARTRSMLVNTALGGVMAFPAAWLVSLALGIDAARIVGHDWLWPIKILAVWIAALFVTRLTFLAAVRSNLFVRRVAMLGDPVTMAPTVAAVTAAQAGFIAIAAGPSRHADPLVLRRAGVLDLVATRSALVAMTATERAAFVSAGVSIETEAQFWERQLKRVDIAAIGLDWVAEIDHRAGGRFQAAIIRLGDVLVSGAMLIFTAPVMVLVAAAVRLESSGPALYRQERVGLGNVPFILLKFRSMQTNAERAGPAWATTSDPRVTRIGGIIRRTRMDELPQLFNILAGQMSFIGPRPERPHFVEKLSAVIPYYEERARVKPGLTGWAQVNFPYGASVEDARVKLSYDLFYVKHRSILLDLTIMFATIRVILFQEGAR